MKSFFAVLLLLGITILGSLLRLYHVSPYKFYPDTYQNLLVAKNLSTYQSVGGYLGENGSIFPSFFAWTRPGYPLLINAVNQVLPTSHQAAQAVALLLGFAAIPMAYLLLHAVTGSQKTGLIAAFLLAISTNHAIWSGFILTESTGVFFMLLVLWLLFKVFTNQSKGSLLYASLTGLVFGYATLVRYEYAALLIPLLFILLYTSHQAVKITMTFLTGFFTVLLIAFFLIYPHNNTIFGLTLGSYINIALTLLAIGGLVAIVFLKNTAAIIISDTVQAILSFPAFIVLGALGISAIEYITKQPPLYAGGLVNFVKADFLIAVCFIVGLLWLSRQKQHAFLVAFITMSLTALFTFYYMVNPNMQRYTTHLLPFILIAASIGLERILSYIRSQIQENKSRLAPLLITPLTLLLFAQWQLTYNGIKSWNNGNWYKTSYEELVANKLSPYLHNQQEILLVSLPESYNYFTNRSTHSLTTYYPYIYIDKQLDGKPLIIIQDMGMRDQFPTFSTFLDTHMQNTRQLKFTVNRDYHFAGRTLPELFPVVMYKTTVGELRNKLTQTQNSAN